MRYPAWSTLDRRLLRDVAAVAGAVGLVGASFGAIAVASGLSIWLVLAMSTLVLAGGAQFMAVGVVAAGGSPVAALLAALLLNARHLPFGMAIADVFGRRWVGRLIGSHLIVDESVAFAMAQPDPQRRRVAYWACGVAVFVTWNAGSVAGALLGNAVADPTAFGVDAAFPAGLLALLMPSLRSRSALPVGLLAAGVALLATPLLPPGLPVLLSLVAVVVVVLVHTVRRVPGRPAEQAP